MKSIKIIRKFVRSHFLLEKATREIIESLPLKLLHRLYYGKTFLYWSVFLKESEYWYKERLEAFQLEQLKVLLKHVQQHVFYYREIFSSYGFNPEKVQCLEDIKTLPYLTRETVSERANDFIAENIPKKALIKTTTSGSTGIPLTIYKTRESDEIYASYLFNIMSRVGFTLKKRTVFFTWRDIKMGKKSFPHSLRVGNKLYLSASNISAERMQKYYELIERFKPEFISGYKTILLSLALFIKERVLLPFTSLKAAFTYAETVYPWQRKVIEETFGARLFTYYGMFEGVIFGGGCEYSNQYHMYPQYGVTEFLEVDGNCQEIVGTGFRNYAMPFIRYRTKDIGVEGKQRCNMCSRNHLLIERIDGRLNEFLVNKKGEMIYSLSDMVPDIFNNVKQFQFYQDKPGIVYMKIVKRNTYSDSDTLMIQKEINKRFSIHVEIVFVDEIEKTSSGKTLIVDQRLDMRKILF